MVTVTKKTLAPLTQDYWTWQYGDENYKISYTVQGTGQPILLLHGFGASIGHWRKNIPVLAAAGYQVFALDLLGFGASDKPPLNYSLELWEEQVKAFWATFINTPMLMVGNSIGGLLSLMVLANSPEMASGGVVINCAGGLNHRPDELNFPLRVVMGLFTKVVSFPLTGKLMFHQIRQKRRIRNTLKQVYCDRNAITEELVELLYRPSCDPGAQKVFASVLSAPPGPRPQDLLPQITQPLLILWGEADPWTPIQGAKIYQDRVKQDPNTQFYAIPQAGHCPHDENPDQVNSRLLEWLEELSY